MYNLSLEQSIYVQAKGFHRAADSLAFGLDKDPFRATAVVTNSAFASELYLKCLIILETGQLIKNQHDLRKLFLKLHEDTQKAIERNFDQEMAKAPEISEAAKVRTGGRKPPRTLREALTQGGDAFIKWRYLYEDESLEFFALFPLPKFLEQTILTRKPEWRDFQLTLAKLPDAPTFPSQKSP
jgi:hypothetical protein